MEKINPLQVLKNLKTKSTNEIVERATIQNFTPCLMSENKSLFKKQVWEISIRDYHLDRIEGKGKHKTMEIMVRENTQRVKDEVSLLIIDLMGFFNVKFGMNKDMIEDVVEMLLTEYKNLTIFDVALCFREVKVGRYGKVYDRLDGGMIMEYFMKYYNGFIDACEEAHNRRKNMYAFGERQSGYKKIWKRN